MISHVVTISQEIMEKKCIKTKIGVGSVVKAEVGDMEENKREERIIRMSKEVVRCVQDVVMKNKSYLKVEDGQKKDMSYC